MTCRTLCNTHIPARSQLIPAAVFVLLVAIILPAAAAGSAAQRYLHARNQLGGDVISEDVLLSGVTADSQGSTYYEVSGRVAGEIEGGDQHVLILQIHSAAVDAVLGSDTDSNVAWLQIGNVIRALLKVQRPQDTGGVELQVVASAPKSDVTALERLAQISSRKLARTRSSSGRQVWADPSRYGWSQSRYAANEAIFSPAGSEPVGSLSPRAIALFEPYRETVCKLNPRLTVSEADLITSAILSDSERWRIDPRLIMAMIVAELSFDTNATSNKGAMGLGQLMPGTASGLGVTNPYDPGQNIAAAVYILANHVQQYGGSIVDCGLVPRSVLNLTMAAYNAGSGAVRKFGGVPPYKETQHYVEKVASIYRQLLMPAERDLFDR